VTDLLRTADVARILGVSPRRVRAMVHAGWCRPERAARAFTFRFQDLVLLRTAHGLAAAHVPPRRVKRALTELLRQLPPERPLSGVRISAAGGRVIVRDRDSVWQPESGQLLLDFAVDELARKSAPPLAGRAARRSGPDAEESAVDWFERGVALEDDDPEAARAAYQQALELDPNLADAYVNLGRLAHEADDPTTAARCYHMALSRDELDPVTHYNLALALEDLSRDTDAVAHYRRAVGLNPSFADAHFNLSQLLGRLGRKSESLRHLVRYRQLLRRRR
jgi:tetratricopeptide (TPR) repeat protein